MTDILLFSPSYPELHQAPKSSDECCGEDCQIRQIETIWHEISLDEKETEMSQSPKDMLNELKYI